HGTDKDQRIAAGSGRRLARDRRPRRLPRARAHRPRAPRPPLRVPVGDERPVHLRHRRALYLHGGAQRGTRRPHSPPLTPPDPISPYFPAPEGRKHSKNALKSVERAHNRQLTGSRTPRGPQFASNSGFYGSDSLKTAENRPESRCAASSPVLRARKMARRRLRDSRIRHRPPHLPI